MSIQIGSYQINVKSFKRRLRQSDVILYVILVALMIYHYQGVSAAIKCAAYMAIATFNMYAAFDECIEHPLKGKNYLIFLLFYHYCCISLMFIVGYFYSFGDNFQIRH